MEFEQILAVSGSVVLKGERYNKSFECPRHAGVGGHDGGNFCWTPAYAGVT